MIQIQHRVGCGQTNRLSLRVRAILDASLKAGSIQNKLLRHQRPGFPASFAARSSARYSSSNLPCRWYSFARCDQASAASGASLTASSWKDVACLMSPTAPQPDARPCATSFQEEAVKL